MKRAGRKPSRKPPRKTSGGPAKNRRLELLALARSFGIEGRHKMTKPQLIRAIESHQRKSRISKPTPLRAKPAQTVSTPGTLHPKRIYDDLPWSYGKTELVLMPVDPFLVHVYWDFSAEDWEEVRARRQPVILRIYDVTMIEFNGANAHSYFDVSVGLEARNWYVPLWSAEKSLCADLGWPLPDGSFETLVRSNVIQTARAGVSNFEETRWIEVRRSRRKTSRLVRRKPTGATPQPAFWPQLEKQAAGMTGEAAGDLSSREIGKKTPHKTPA